MNFYNKLEKRFDELTPDWIVPTGAVVKGFANKEKLKWQLAIKFKNKIVRKASPIKGQDGNVFWNPIDAKVGIPDFVVMSSDQYDKFLSMINNSTIDYTVTIYRTTAFLRPNYRQRTRDILGTADRAAAPGVPGPRLSVSNPPHQLD